ncbi:MAG: S1 RNA-binding domain-containing protein [Candidatus Levyibacteriota bacterium]
MAKQITNSKSQSSSKPTTMAELLATHKTSFVNVSKGQIVTGVVTKLTSGEILVDIGAKTEALVMEKDKRILKSLLSSLKIGDKVTVTVLNPESDYGNPVVSLRRFNDDRVWVRLEELKQNKEQIDVLVGELTKGGFLVSTKDGMTGFLPNSQTTFLQNAQELVGKEIKVTVIELSRPLRKVIFSQKATVAAEDFVKATNSLKVGQEVEATISNVAPFGIFLLMELSDKSVVEGFVHISEISWEKLATIPESYKAGDKIKAKIIGFDRESKRVNLSIKALTADPFAEKLKSYSPDQRVSGSVSKVLSSGVLVNLEKGIEGFIKKEKIPVTVTYSEGSQITATVVEVDNKRHRVILVPVLTEKPMGYR